MTAPPIQSKSWLLQIVSAQAMLLQSLVLAIAVIFIVLQATGHKAQSYKKALLIASAAIALLCLTVTLAMGCMLFRGTYDNIIASKRW